jgi:hypothetical protein
MFLIVHATVFAQLARVGRGAEATIMRQEIGHPARAPRSPI